MSSRASSQRTLVSPLPRVGGDDRGSLPIPDDVVLSKIRIERVLGEGGMSVVFAARHELLDLPVALKILHPYHSGDEAVSRFFHEAKIAARIKSEHVCGILDVGLMEDGLPYILMDFLEGVTLAELLATRGSLGVGEAVDLALQALEGLTHAHAEGVVHRDLKPSNLFVALSPKKPPTLKIIDFGISKSQMLEGVTRVGSFIGSPTYAAPEQITEPHTVDARSDLWAVGVVLYELLTGEVPFDGPTIDLVLARILHEAPRPLWRPDLPRELAAVIMRCLRKPREERYASTFELAAALAPFAATPPGARLQRIAAAANVEHCATTPVSVAPSSERPSGMRPRLTTAIVQSIPPPPPVPTPDGARDDADTERAKLVTTGIVAFVVCLAVLMAILALLPHR